jgi:DNA-binding GntR family transcriptional regulator
MRTPRLRPAFRIPFEIVADTPKLTQAGVQARLYTAILERIVRGELASGERLVEIDLARTYHVSRTPIRDALLALRKDGLVEQEHNCGARVASFTARDVEDLFDIRKAVEVFCVPFLVQSGKVSDLLELQHRMLALDGLTGQPWRDESAALDMDFHQLIVASSNNRRLIAYIRNLDGLVQSLRKVSYRQDRDGSRIRESARGHLAVMDALLAHDAALAQRLLVEHIERGKRNTVALFIRSRKDTATVEPGQP